jgi:N-acetylneuraminic acid mutarotase
VLAAGGNDGNTLLHGYATSAESYVPSRGLWTTTGSLNVARDNRTATLLANGEVLVAGGTNYNGTLAEAELYNPSTGLWSTTGSMNTARAGRLATLLEGGQVLVVGGDSTGASTEFYTP